MQSEGKQEIGDRIIIGIRTNKERIKMVGRKKSKTEMENLQLNN